MAALKYKEQYARARRYFEKLIQLKNVGSAYRDPKVMTPDELAQYGLATADRDRIHEWMRQIPGDATAAGQETDSTCERHSHEMDHCFCKPIS